MAKKATFSFYLPKMLVLKAQQAADDNETSISRFVEAAIVYAIEADDAEKSLETSGAIACSKLAQSAQQLTSQADGGTDD